MRLSSSKRNNLLPVAIAHAGRYAPALAYARPEAAHTARIYLGQTPRFIALPQKMINHARGIVFFHLEAVMKKSFPVIFSLLLVSVFGIRAGFAEDGASSVNTPAGESAAATLDSGNAQTDAAADAADHANGEAAAESVAQPGETVISESDGLPSAEPDVSNQPEFVPGHKIHIAPYPKDKIIHATLITSAGNISCQLYAGAHPMTVMNFVALAKGKPGWTDASGVSHSEPYYKGLAFGNRVKNAYAAVSARPEGTDFLIPDERCSVHGPKAGAIAMLQPYPGQASTRFVLLARDEPNFKGMYAFFGACEPIDTIRALTKQEDAKLERIEIEGNP